MVKVGGINDYGQPVEIYQSLKLWELLKLHEEHKDIMVRPVPMSLVENSIGIKTWKTVQQYEKIMFDYLLWDAYIPIKSVSVTRYSIHKAFADVCKSNVESNDVVYKNCVPNEMLKLIDNTCDKLGL